jgi:hypothetical protein
MMSCALILIGIASLPLVGALLSLVAWIRLNTFTQSVPAIAAPRDLDELKRVVKLDMYLALVMIALVLGTAGLFGLGVWIGCFGVLELTCLLTIVSPFAIVAGILLKRAEAGLKAVPVTDDSLQAEHAHVIKRWSSSALPDW